MQRLFVIGVDTEEVGKSSSLRKPHCMEDLNVPKGWMWKSVQEELEAEKMETREKSPRDLWKDSEKAFPQTSTCINTFSDNASKKYSMSL